MVETINRIIDSIILGLLISVFLVGWSILKSEFRINLKELSVLSNLLIFRLIVLNLLGFALVGWATSQGWITTILEQDTTTLSVWLCVLFVYGLIGVFMRAKKITTVLNLLKTNSDVHTQHINGRKMKIKNQYIGEIAAILVTLGFIGTLVGLGLAIHDGSSFDFSTTTGTQAFIKTVFEGMGIAIYSAIVGSVLGVWLEINRVILATATDCMIEDLDTLRQGNPKRREA